MPDQFLNLVKRFVTVAEVGSIQGAAKALNLSQPSLTQSIKRIEEMYACKLFERTKKGVILTITGERLYLRSKNIIDQGTLAREEIQDIVTGGTGVLRITAGTAWGSCFLPPIIRDLHGKFPELKIELDIGLTPIALERLYRGDVDLVLGEMKQKDAPPEGFIKQHLLQQHYTVGCNHQSSLAHADTVSPEELIEFPIVMFHEDSHVVSNVIGPIEKKLGRKFSVVVQTKSLLAAIGMVVEGPFIVFLTKPILELFTSSGIRIVNLDRPLFEFETGMAYRESLRQTEPFEHLLTTLRNFSTEAQ